MIEYTYTKGVTAMTDEKKTPAVPEKPQTNPEPIPDSWVDDMKQDLEDYIEEQGIYIRQ